MSKLQGRPGRTGGLARQPSAGQTNEAMGDSFPAQDGQAFSQAAASIFSGGAGFDQGKASNIVNAANQTRAFNDLVVPEEPMGKKYKRDGKRWERKLFRFLCECQEPTFPTLPISIEHLGPTFREHLKLAGITGSHIDVAELTEIFKQWRISIRDPDGKRGKGRGMDRSHAHGKQKKRGVERPQL